MEPILTTPDQLYRQIEDTLGNLDGRTVRAVSSLWYAYAKSLYDRGELARQKLEVLQKAADMPHMN